VPTFAIASSVSFLDPVGGGLSHPAVSLHDHSSLRRAERSSYLFKKEEARRLVHARSVVWISCDSENGQLGNLGDSWGIVGNLFSEQGAQKWRYTSGIRAGFSP
jgi:hypothetical protein